MSQEVDDFIDSGKESMNATIAHLQKELSKIRAGKASPAILEGLMVDYYGTPTAISQVANISAPDSKTIAIQPWEKKLLGDIEQAIFKANLGLTPMNDGEFVRITMPPMTEERRIQLVKQSKSAGEDAKVSLRQTRQKIMDFIKKAVKDGYPEDMGKTMEDSVQGMVKGFGENIDNIIKSKEDDIMKV